MASRARRSGSQMNGGGGQPAFSTRDPALARKCVSQASDHQTRAGKQPLEEHTRATFGAHTNTYGLWNLSFVPKYRNKHSQLLSAAALLLRMLLVKEAYS